MVLNTVEVQVFVSCPGDVTDEKNEIKDICESINSVFRQTGYTVRFTVLDWRDIVGQFGPRPQAQINVIVGEYDIYLGLLWMRFGTPTGGIDPNTNEDFGSGTIEEFHLAYERWKDDDDAVKVFIFFKRPDNSVGSNLDKIEQMKKVLEFKDRIQKLSWVNEFADQKAFNKKIREALEVYGIKLHNKHTASAVATIRDGQQPESDSANNPEAVVTTEMLLEFVRDAEPINISYYITRTIVKIEDKNRRALEIFSDRPSNKSLSEEILRHNKIVILGNAGSGKSVELKTAVSIFQKDHSPLIPVYKRFNTYLDQEIEQFLPEGWNKIDDSLLVIFFDGLDEILPEYRNTAIRKLLEFSGKRPQLKIVVSSRTNFYNIAKDGNSGTLPGFECFYLSDLADESIETYLVKAHNIDSKKFILEAKQERFGDFIQSPFFLNVLIKKFIRDGNLKGSRSKIFEDFLEEKLHSDIAHFETTFALGDLKYKSLTLLKRIALVMETLGRNYLDDAEMAKVAGDDLHSQLKYFTALVKKGDGSREIWMFEHNNIQEYLAAKSLSQGSVEQVKRLIAVGEDAQRIKPTWLNTLAFWVSIADQAELAKLLDWLLHIDVEIIVRFEADRISPALRFDIFRRIFEFYKGKDIWLHSNKFSSEELARFVDSGDLVNFLISELSSSDSSRRTILNALSLLNGVDFTLTRDHLSRLKDLYLMLLVKYQNDDGLAQKLLYAMSRLEINESEIENILSLLGSRQNQYVRSGVYRLINTADQVDKYINYYLEGLSLTGDFYKHEEREDIIFFDEILLITAGLESVQETSSLIKLFHFLGDSKAGRRFEIHELPKILQTLITKAVLAHKNDAAMYDAVLHCFKTFGKLHRPGLAGILRQYFVQTRTSTIAFLNIWKDNDLKNYEKWILIAAITDKGLVDWFINAYIARDFNNEDAKEFHHTIRWASSGQTVSFELLTVLEQGISEAGGPHFTAPTPVDHTARDHERRQHSFNLLFNKEELKQEIRQIFNEIGKTEVTFNDLWDSLRIGWDSEKYFAESARSLIQDFTRNNGSTTEAGIVTWLEREKNFEQWSINQIHELIKAKASPQITELQRDHIFSWVRRTLLTTDITKSVKAKDDKGSNTIGMTTVLLWDFIKHFNFEVSEEKLLDFTLIYDHDDFDDKTHGSILKRIEGHVGEVRLQGRVLANLEAGIDVGWVWKNNVLYAISCKLTSSYKFILRDIVDVRKSVYDRADVLRAYYSATDDDSALLNCLYSLGEDELRWRVIDELLPKPSNRRHLVSYLEVILNNDKEEQEERLRSSKSLMKLDELRGLQFYTEYFEALNEPGDDGEFTYDVFSGINTIDALPYLIRLLFLARQPQFLIDDYRNLHSSVMDRLNKIALISEHNLKCVVSALRSFIGKYSEKLENLNFMEYAIRQMEDQFYENQSKNLTVYQAISLVDEILSKAS